MELVISILILFILVNCLLKLSFWKGWQAAVVGLICGNFITATYPFAMFCVLCGCIAGMVRATGKVVGEALEMVSDPTYFSRPVLFTDRADL